MTSQAFDINRAKAALANRQGPSRVSGESKTAKSRHPPKFSEVATRQHTIDAVISKYTGLPIGPKSAQEQDALLERWERDGFKFPNVSLIRKETERMRKSGIFVIPQNNRRRTRRSEILALLSDIGISLTDDDLCTLALGKGSLRKAYWICCSLYGNHRRAQNVSRTDTLTTHKPTDSDDVKNMKTRLKEQSQALKECQREWQRKIEALKAQHSDLLKVISQLQTSTDELRADLAIQPVEPSSADEDYCGSGTPTKESNEENEPIASPPLEGPAF